MEGSRGLVLDTSVWINLLATEAAWTILEAYGRPCLTPRQVVDEVQRDPVTQRAYPKDHHPLERRGDVEVVQLNDEELELFMSLVAERPADALGDGEAAAIAVARVRRCAVALDERKARRIVRERFPDTLVVMTVDILEDPRVGRRLGPDGSRDAFERARQFGRMHVPKSRLKKVR